MGLAIQKAERCTGILRGKSVWAFFFSRTFFFSQTSFFSKSCLISIVLITALSPVCADEPHDEPQYSPQYSDVERVFRMVQAVSDADIPPLSVIREHCGEDTLCAAKILARAIGPEAWLEPVQPTSTDTIRWVRSTPSITGYQFSHTGVLTLNLDHFGRQAIDEITDIIQAETHPSRSSLQRLSIDLRENSGGSFDRMLQIASLFTGHIPGAVQLVKTGQVTHVDIPANTAQRPSLSLHVPIDILIGPKTASSAEVFAALLKQHAGARLIGEQTYGKNYLLRIVPIHHTMRLLIPDAQITVPGVRLAGGLVPDRPATKDTD